MRMSRAGGLDGGDAAGGVSPAVRSAAPDRTRTPAAGAWRSGHCRYAARVGTLILSAVALVGCQGISMGAGSVAQLRVIDASPDAPAIDSYQNNAALAYNLGFGTATSYVAMLPGSYMLAADRAGTRQALVEGPASLSAGHQYTAIVGNVNAAMQQTLLLDQSTPAPAGEIAVRLVDQATHAGAVDVYLVPKAGKLSTTAPIATGLNFGSNSGYLDLPAGVYELAVMPAGTGPARSTVTLLSGAQVEYASGAVRTIVLIDTASSTASALSPGASLSAAPPAAAGVQAIIADDSDPSND